MSRTAPKRRTIGSNNPLDRLGDDPLGFIPGRPPSEPQQEPGQAGPEAVGTSTPEPPALKQISARIPVGLYRQLKVSVARSGESQQDFLTRVIRRHVEGDAE